MHQDAMRMTEGPIPGQILRFAAPLFLGNLFQPLYNTADALIVGSPIYFGNLSGLAVNFLERLLFMNYTYDLEAPTKFSGKIASALVCTMNVDEETMKAWGYVPIFERYTQSLGLLLGGPSEWLSANDTLQYPDYGKYMSRAVDPAHKLKMREEKFPKDQEAARQLGARLAAA